MENKKEISYAKKVWALQKANPKLSDTEACLLLGITTSQLKIDRKEESEVSNIFKGFSDVFGGIGL